VFGVLSSLLSSLILRLGLRGTWKDAFLGAIAVPIGMFLVFITPWPENTIHTPNGGGGEMRVTMHTFQHPFVAAFVLAAILPALRSLYRLRQARKDQTAYGNGSVSAKPSPVKNSYRNMEISA
jgi:hypothetical protein